VEVVTELQESGTKPKKYIMSPVRSTRVRKQRKAYVKSEKGLDYASEIAGCITEPSEKADGSGCARVS
jgi:hypothetical protein